MTLCVSWIRQVNNRQELVFATDSCLSEGARWHSGVKLFELPRRDCVICFAGDTMRTYPLILNLISSIKFDEHLSNRNTDIQDVLEYLSNLFTNLCNSITDFGTQKWKDVISDFEFMFGGWSWKANRFKVWKLKYSFDSNSFLHNEVDSDNMFFAFIGDNLEEAQSLLVEELKTHGKVLSRNFDMEPFMVLLKMIRDKDKTHIDGAIQLAKIYPPGETEFFGIVWNGKKTFLGRDVTQEHNPSIRFIEPDTCTFISEELPTTIKEISEKIFGSNYEFVQNCYKNGKLDTELTDRKRATLKSILQEVAYAGFIEKQEKMEIGDEYDIPKNEELA